MSPSVSIRPELFLETSGTKFKVDSLQQAILVLSQQALAHGKSVTLQVAGEKDLAWRIDAAGNTTPISQDSTDAILHVEQWHVYVHNQSKVRLPKLQPLLRVAAASAKHLGEDRYSVMQLTGEEILSLYGQQISTQRTVPTADFHLQEDVPEETPIQEKSAADDDEFEPEDVGPEVFEPKLVIESDTVQTSAPEPETTFDENLEDSAPEDTEPAAEAWEPTPVDHEEQLVYTNPDGLGEELSTIQMRRRPRGTIVAVTISLSAALLLGGGSLAMNYLNPGDAPAPAPSATTADPAPQPQPPVPGVNPVALQRLPHAYTDLVLSTDGKYFALQTSDNEVTIAPVTVTDKNKTTVLKVDGKISTEIYPLAAPESGFIIRSVAQGSGVNSKATLTVWSTEHGEVHHDLPIGSNLAHRDGHTWITSTIATAAPKTALVVTAEKLRKYTAPGVGPAFFSLAGKDQALWASLSTDNSAGIIAATPAGKQVRQAKLQRPATSATVARWLTSTQKYALLVWQDSDSYVLAIHDTKTGKIKNQTDFAASAGTDIKQLIVQTSPTGNVAVFGSAYADLAKGSFTPPEPLKQHTGDMTLRYGGIETLDPHTFTLLDGKPSSVPDQGTVLAVTKEVVIIEKDNVIAFYKKNTK